MTVTTRSKDTKGEERKMEKDSTNKPIEEMEPKDRLAKEISMDEMNGGISSYPPVVYGPRNHKMTYEARMEAKNQYKEELKMKRCRQIVKAMSLLCFSVALAIAIPYLSRQKPVVCAHVIEYCNATADL